MNFHCIPTVLLLTLILVSSIDNSLQQDLSAFHEEFAERRDENIRQLIEKEKLTCDNVEAFCYQGHTEAELESEKVARLICTGVLKTYVCPEVAKAIENAEKKI
ncbi:uncharacterized protein LOC106658057 [Trichogramma pretiosum]|uniref:uncharacterized protein LOC106658057 n=1 Tax=Trichogramma pretiosum TaxID=7493 RepID=UPI0006C97A07|nr:uncharacterized protein LOC106658057 [Trichogramma pretiosum]